MPQHKKIPMLVTLYAAAFVSAFNENIINVALIDIMAEFGIESTTAQWLVTGYMAVTAVIVAMMAFLMRRFSTRQLFFMASTCFVVGEAACIVAPSFPLLLAARLLQAIGSGTFTPLMMSAVLALAPRDKVGTYLSIGSACITLGPAFAPVCSGFVVTLAGWRMVFAAPSAIAALIAIIGAKLIVNIGERGTAKLDIPSLVLALICIPLFVYGLGAVTITPMFGLIAIAISIALLVIFARRQQRIDEPFLDMRPILRNRSFATASVLVVIAMMTTFSMGILLPLYFEASFAYSALIAGALTLPAIIVNAITAIIGGRAMDRFGAWPLLPIGFGFIVIGQVIITTFAPDLALGMTIAASIAVYAGVGLVMAPSQTAGLSALPRSQHAHGVSTMNTLIMISASFGPSLFVGVFSSNATAAAATELSEPLAQAQGFASAVALAAVIALVGFAISFAYSLKIRHKKLSPVVLRTMDLNAEDRPAPTLESIMRADPYTVDSRATVRDVARILVGTHTSGVPIIDEDYHVLGFVSDGDVLRAFSSQRPAEFDLGYYVMRNVDKGFDDDDAFARIVDETMKTNALDIATRRVVTIDISTPLEDVCTMLRPKQFKKAPVVRDDRLVGTISRNDVVRYLMGVLAE